MITRVKGLKISQVPELKEITGEEMIPYQYKCTNGKISATTLANFISENLDPNDPTGEIGQLREDVDNLTERVTTNEKDIDTLENQVTTNTGDIQDIKDRLDSGTGGGSDADYVNKKLEEFKATKGQPDGLASLDSDGKLTESQLPDNVINIEGFQPITYSALKSKVDNGQLEPGVKYGISDYSCAYIMPQYENETNIEVEYPATDFQYIVCTAVNSNTLDHNVQIIREEGKRKILEAKYSIDPEFCLWTRGMTTKTPKGVIYYLKDSALNVATYDFKHIKFRRWAITNITANMTPDNGSNANVSPYRVMVNENSRQVSDSRQFCGSSDPIEETLIPAIFEGTWRCGDELVPRFPDLKTNNGLNVSIMPYHEEYIKRAIKPYTDTNYPADKYLAWQTDMHAVGGVSGEYYSNYPFLGGLSNVTVDADDYMDRYTFDCDGEDASEIDIPNKDNIIPLVSSTIIEQITNSISLLSLPNTIIAISKSIYDKPEDVQQNSYVKDNILRGSISRNTILLNKACPRIGTVQFSRNRLGTDSVQFGANLIIVNYTFNMNCIKYCKYNFICGMVEYFDAESMWNNVMFGYYNKFDVKSMRRCLFFGSDYYIRTINDSNWVACKDGEYWYDTTIRADFYTNIMGPCQYSTFEPHCNSNLFRAIYNKGIYFRGSTQLCSYGWTAWGVEIGYSGSGEGNYFGSMIHTIIPSTAFNGAEGGTGKFDVVAGVEKLKASNAAKKTPMLTEVDIVSTYPADPHTMIETITATEHYPSTKCRHIIFVGSDGKWHQVNWRDLVEGTAGISTLTLEEQDELPMTLEDFANRYGSLYPEPTEEPGLPYNEFE